MRTQQEFLSAYAQSHRNAVNRVIHVVCVPVIAFSTLGLLWVIPIGAWLGFPPGEAVWVNVVTLMAVPVVLFYLQMSLASLATMSLWYAASVFGIVMLQHALGTLGLVIVCAALWLGAWALQLYGHKLEGAKPSFIEDLTFLLIGPLFVMDEMMRRLGGRRPR